MFTKLSKDEQDANKLIQRALIAATQKKDVRRLKVGRKNLYQTLHRKGDIVGYVDYPEPEHPPHTWNNVYMPNDFNLADVHIRKIPTFHDLTFDINHMLTNANIMKMKSNELLHRANALENEASMLHEQSDLLSPSEAAVERKHPVMAQNEIISPEIQPLVTTTPHEQHHEVEVVHEHQPMVTTTPHEEHHESPNDKHDGSTTVSHAIETTETKIVPLAHTSVAEDTHTTYTEPHTGKVELVAHNEHPVPMVETDANLRLKSGKNGQGPERGGSAASPTVPAILTDNHESPVTFKVNTGYPVYHLPSTSEETAVTEFEKPLPPVDGVNPYEVLTSSSLNGSAYQTHTLPPAIPILTNVVKPLPIVQNFVKKSKGNHDLQKSRKNHQKKAHFNRHTHLKGSYNKIDKKLIGALLKLEYLQKKGVLHKHTQLDKKHIHHNKHLQHNNNNYNKHSHNRRSRRKPHKGPLQTKWHEKQKNSLKKQSISKKYNNIRSKKSSYIKHNHLTG